MKKRFSKVVGILAVIMMWVVAIMALGMGLILFMGRTENDLFILGFVSALAILCGCMMVAGLIRDSYKAIKGKFFNNPPQSKSSIG